MTNTDNQGYNLPEFKSEKWDKPLNENFNLIDEDVKIFTTAFPTKLNLR